MWCVVRNMCDLEHLVRLERHRLMLTVAPMLTLLEAAIASGNTSEAMDVLCKVQRLIRVF